LKAINLTVSAAKARGALSDLESGRRTGTAETIAKLAQVLDVPVDGLSWSLNDFPRNVTKVSKFFF
jgi:transcriptional regulator with XRE-family HTH domain